MSPQVAKVRGEEEAGGGTSFQVPGSLSRLMEYPRRARQFLHEVRVEMKQVTWPTRSDVRATTVVVIITVAFFAAFFFVVDTAVAHTVQRVFALFKR